MTKKFLRSIFILSILFALLSCASNSNAGNKPGKLVFPKRPSETVKMLYNTAAMKTPSMWGSMNVHDPSIIKDGNMYYVFSTDVAVGNPPTKGVQIRKSKDLIKWDYVGQALNDVPKEAAEYANATCLWAPDVIKVGETYFMYYSASIIGEQTSCIGVATAKNITGPYTDQGLIIKSDFFSVANAIDPSVFIDQDGKLRLTYGSFAGGIMLLELDKTTGKPLPNQGEGKLIATRGAGVGEEGPYIIYNPDFKKYYLFVSYDSFMTDYSIRVGRADNVEGPYYDMNGRKMTDFPFSKDLPPDVDIISADIGYKMMGGYIFSNAKDYWLAPGHNSVLNDNGNWYLCHHARPSNDKNWPYLHIRKILWSDDGWPMANAERYAGEFEQPIPQNKVICENWEIVQHHRCSNENAKAMNFALKADGTVTCSDSFIGNGTWTYTEPASITISVKNGKGRETIIKGKLLACHDWDANANTITFTGIDNYGQAWFGKQILK